MSTGSTTAAVARPGGSSEFEADVLGAVGSYKNWPQLTRRPAWAPLLCDISRPSWFATAHISASGDEATHGRKLYHLYAMDSKAYFAETGLYAGDSGKHGPVPTKDFEQVLVKDSFQSVRLDAPERELLNDRRAAKGAHDERAYDGDAQFTPGAPIGQFLMVKYPAVAGRARAGTDQGWVYATVSPAGSILQIGMIESCMGCHTRAPHGRLFGISAGEGMRVGEVGANGYQLPEPARP